MALKRTLTKEEFDKLPKDIQTEYTTDGDGYKLDIIGDEDTGALKRAKDREKQDRIAAEKRAKEAEDKLAEIEGNDARKSGDIDKLEAAWKKEKEDLIKASDEKLAKRDAALKKSLVDDTALKIATKISSSPALLIPHIKSRLQADLDADTPTTKVLGLDGNLSSATLDDLEKEFVANKDFSAIIIAGKGSGGSTKNDHNRGGAAKSNINDGDNTPNLSKLSPKDLAARIAERKEQQND